MFWLKAAITAVIFYIIYQTIDVDAVYLTLAAVNMQWLCAALALQILAIVLASLRWAWLMQYLPFNHAYSFYIKHYFIGMLFSQALPSSVGGDAYRVVALVRAAQGKKRLSFYAVLIDRVMGLWGLLILVFLGLVFSDIALPQVFMSLIQLVLFVGLVMVAVLLMLHKIPRLKVRFISWFWDVSALFYQALSSRQQILRQLTTSVLIHILATASVFCIANALALNQPYSVFLLFIPISLLVTIVPISLAGWGVREGAMVLLFSLVGAAKETVLSMSLLYGVVLICASLPAGYFLLKKKK